MKYSVDITLRARPPPHRGFPWDTVHPTLMMHERERLFDIAWLFNGCREKFSVRNDNPAMCISFP